MTSNPTDEMVKLLRFQILDERNGAISGEPDAIRLCGAAADMIEDQRRRLESSGLKRLETDLERDAAVEEVARLTHRLERIEKIAAAGGDSMACIAILEEIAHERAHDAEQNGAPSSSDGSAS